MRPVVKNEISSNVQMHLNGQVPPPQMKSLGNPPAYDYPHPNIMASVQNGGMGAAPVNYHAQHFKKPSAPRRKIKENKVKRPMNNYLVCLFCFLNFTFNF